MSTEVKTGWLKDKNGDKFAPKTLTSQVQTNDGTLLEDKLTIDLNQAKTEVYDKIQNNLLGGYALKKDVPTKISDLINDSDFGGGGTFIQLIRWEDND